MIIIGDLASDFLDNEDFILQNRNVIHDLIPQVESELSGEFANKDELREGIAAGIVLTLYIEQQGYLDISQDEFLDKYEELMNLLNIYLMIWDLENLGLLQETKKGWITTEKGNQVGEAIISRSNEAPNTR